MKHVDMNDYEEDPVPRRRREITEEWRPVSVRLAPALHDAAIRKALHLGCSVTDVIRTALQKDLGIPV